MKKYIDYAHLDGYPSGKDIWYECTKCKDVIISNPISKIDVTCKCGNICIDLGYGRLCIEDHDYFKIFTYE